METEKKKRGARLRAVRTKLNLSQTEFGTSLGGIKTSSISGYESGDTYPKPDILAKIAELGQVSLAWLITGKEEAAVQMPQTLSPAKEGECKQQQHSEVIEDEAHGRRGVTENERHEMDRYIIEKLEILRKHDIEAYIDILSQVRTKALAAEQDGRKKNYPEKAA